MSTQPISPAPPSKPSEATKPREDQEKSNLKREDFPSGDEEDREKGHPGPDRREPGKEHPRK